MKNALKIMEDSKDGRKIRVAKRDATPNSAAAKPRIVKTMCARLHGNPLQLFNFVPFSARGRAMLSGLCNRPSMSTVRYAYSISVPNKGLDLN